MPRQSPLLKFNRTLQDIPIDGCGSHCPACVANNSQCCTGCTRCNFFNKCSQDGCQKCGVRCWQHSTPDQWMQDIGDLALDECSCPAVFDGDLPSYVPQVQHCAWECPYPAYIININKVLHPQTLGWRFRQHGIKENYQILPASKLILTFCTKDELLEKLWTYSENWQNGQSIWDGLAYYTRENLIKNIGHGDLDASMSMEFSCFSDTPRMEHLINIKRNIISAHEFSHRGVPMILDAMGKDKMDLARLVHWGVKNAVKWYVLNCQGTKKVPWVMKWLRERIDLILSSHRRNKVLVSGIADIERIRHLVDAYGKRISLTNTVVSMKSNYFNEFTGKGWVKSNKPNEERFAFNLRKYTNAAGLSWEIQT